MTISDKNKNSTLSVLLADSRQEEKMRKMMQADIQNYINIEIWKSSREEQQLMEDRKSGKISPEEAKVKLDQIVEKRTSIKNLKKEVIDAPPKTYTDAKKKWDAHIAPLGNEFVSNVKTIQNIPIQEIDGVNIWVPSQDFYNQFYIPYEHSGIMKWAPENQPGVQPQGSTQWAPEGSQWAPQWGAPAVQWGGKGVVKPGVKTGWTSGKTTTDTSTTVEEKWNYQHVQGNDLDDTIPMRFQTSNDPNVKDEYARLKAMPLKERQEAINELNLQDAKGKIDENITTADIEKYRQSASNAQDLPWSEVKKQILYQRAKEYHEKNENAVYTDNARKAWITNIMQPWRADILKTLAENEIMNENASKDPGAKIRKAIWPDGKEIETKISDEERKFMDEYKWDFKANRFASQFNDMLHEYHNTTDNVKKMELKRQMIQTASNITDKTVYDSLHGGKLLPFLRWLGLDPNKDKQTTDIKAWKDETKPTDTTKDTTKPTDTTKDTTKPTDTTNNAGNVDTTKKDPTQNSTDLTKQVTGAWETTETKTTDAGTPHHYDEVDEEEDMIPTPQRANYATDGDYQKAMEQYNGQIEDKARQYRASGFELNGSPKQIQRYKVAKDANGNVMKDANGKPIKEKIGNPTYTWTEQAFQNHINNQADYNKTNTPVAKVGEEDPNKMMENRQQSDKDTGTAEKQQNSNII